MMEALGYPLDTPVERALPEDLETITRLMGVANDYSIQRSGLPMWTSMDRARAQVEQGIDQGNCYVIRKDDDIKGGVVLLEEDTPIWGDQDGLDGRALYFHKLMKDPNTPGAGVALIKFTAEEAVRRGKGLLRCDTKPTMERLTTYYARLGFAQVRTFTYRTSGLEAVLLEADPEVVIRNVEERSS